jgi:hypothetical protein
LLEVFDDPSLSFGSSTEKRQSAGFVTQLAALLGRPLDSRTWINTGGVKAINAISDVSSQKELVIFVVRAGDL